VAFGDKTAAAALGRATLIWMPGGDQNRFMKAIDGTGLADVIRERHRAGVTVGGTSAGAAVIAEAMFTGDADRIPRAARVDKVPAGALESGRDLKLTVLHAGQRYSLK
jgi:cyanophycinase-like exopeptidase